MANAQNKYEQAMTGSGEETFAIAYQYATTQVTIKGLATGTATVRAKAKESDVLETVQGGEITLDTERTITINDASLEQLGITVSAGTAYTLIVRQTDKRYS